jgi:tRNA(Ile)-lysidine synthase
MPALAAEGLDARRLAGLARRAARAEQALAAAAEGARRKLSLDGAFPGRAAFDATRYRRLPDEIGLRLIGRAVAEAGDEGPVELAKLEALKASLDAALAENTRFRRSLAGALVTLTGQAIVVERAPPRRSRNLTKRRGRKARGEKTR